MLFEANSFAVRVYTLVAEVVWIILFGAGLRIIDVYCV